MEPRDGGVPANAGEPCADMLGAGNAVGADGAGDVEPDEGWTTVAVLVVVITEDSGSSGSSTVKSSGSAGSVPVHAHAAASSKTTSRLMWTRRVVGS